MGLLDQALGAVTGQQAGSPETASPLMHIVTQLISSYPGGLPGLIAQFSQSGLGQQANSWVSLGANEAISAEDLGKVLGGSASPLSEVLSRFGMNQGDALEALAQALPDAVNRLTPNGRIEEESLEQRLTALLNRFG